MGHCVLNGWENTMPQPDRSASSWVLWPLRALWRLLTWILELTGRFVAVTIGVVLMIGGAVISVTVIGAIIGVPLAVFGFMLVLRGLF